jgi:excisionase family DNA binding protein
LDTSRGQLLNVKQVADYLGCSERNVYALLDRGELPYILIGATKGYRIDPADLRAFVDRRKLRTEPPRKRLNRPRLKHITL